MKTSDQIKMIRKMENLTQAEFAKELGVSTATIASIENDSRDIPKTLIKKLVKEKNINANWLITGEEPVFLENKETKQSIIAAQRIPLLRQTVSCGPGQDWDSGDNVETYIEPLGLITRGKQLYAFRSRGLSMAGVGIQDGDILIFDGDKSQSLQDDIYVFGYNGEAFCKLLRFDIFAEKIHVYSVPNKDMDKAELLKTLDSSTEGFQIFGRVLCWIHENHLMWR